MLGIMRKINIYILPAIALFSSGWIIGLIVRDIAWFEYDSSFASDLGRRPGEV